MSQRFRFVRHQSRRRFLQAGSAIGLSAAAAAQVGITLAQEGSPEAGEEQLWYEDTQGPAQQGGTVRFLLYEDPNTLNPILGWTTIAIQVINAISEGLPRTRRWPIRAHSRSQPTREWRCLRGPAHVN